MARAICTIEGFIASAESKMSPTGKEFYEIRMSTGSKRKEDGSYDNRYQTWWSLTAWGEYGQKLKFDCFQKGDYIRATVQNPHPKAYRTKDGRLEASMQGALWNYSLSKVHFLPKSFNSPDEAFYDNAPLPDDLGQFDDSAFDNVDIPF